jgi:hypothetical protein
VNCVYKIDVPDLRENIQLALRPAGS